MDDNVIQLSPLLKHYVGSWRFSNAANRTKISQQLFHKSVNCEIAFNCPHRFPIIAASLKCYLVKGCCEIQFPFWMGAIIFFYSSLSLIKFGLPLVLVKVSGMVLHCLTKDLEIRIVHLQNNYQPRLESPPKLVIWTIT